MYDILVDCDLTATITRRMYINLQSVGCDLAATTPRRVRVNFRTSDCDLTATVTEKRWIAPGVSITTSRLDAGRVDFDRLIGRALCLGQLMRVSRKLA